ncbi:uncharacterized protein BDFB_003951 [Asbolus verrucosus]|uniref:Uncharacterized protein n=1 Tax=Asbolus verrucosus TaxID=1661398 RepID=A0A482VIP7_ASBVE|nr:uncharacterized protein BDFB_003951 [Asbolus verrucosus]
MDSTPNCDVVEKLLQMTGLSCNDLLIKLQQYKTRQTEKATEEKDSSLSNSSSQEEIFSDEKLCTNDKISVIREAKSCVNEVARDKDLETEISCNNHNSNDNVAIDPTIIMNKLIDVPDAVNFQDIKDLSCQDKNNKSTNSTVNEMIARDSSNKVNRQNSEDSSGSQNSKDGISTNSIVNETIKEDCSDGINFQNSDDSSSYQKDVFQSDVQCGSLQKNEAANADPIKNLHNCPSMDDHNYSNTNNNVDLEQDISTSSTDDLHKSEDNLRNIIRMQLSSLRNMKKSSTYLPDLQKRRSIFFHNLKKKRKSCDVNSVTPISVNDEIKEKRQDEENEDSKKNKDSNMNDDSLISLSDETDFVIMNVTGGVDRVTPEENTKLNITDSEERRFAVITEASKKTAIDFVSKDKIINDNNQEFSQNTTKIVRSPRKEIKNILTNYRRKMSLNYFDENRYTFASPRTEDKSKTLTVKKNISETFNEDPGINKSVKNSEKSPFISDSLEDFLNESSQLKISYSIPKLGAEEGIGERTKKSPFDNVVGKMPRTETGNEQDTPQKEKTKLIKAKTLAEMRRHFEKLKSKNKIVSAPQDIEISPLKGNPEENSNKLTSVLKYPKKITNIAPHRNSFIIYNKKKMWIPSRNKNKCVAVIDPPRRSIKEAVREKTKLSPFTPKVGQIIHRKLSLLSALNEKKPCVIKYKPGPLCRKAHLQNTESRDTWTTEIKTLPKIYFEVVPEINKPIDPCFIHLLPVFEDVVITEERTNFALSVLKLKNENVKPESFKFHVAYNNKQEKMVVRKRFQPATYKVNTPNSETNPATDVANVLNDIIRYIELKEIEDTLIKEDDTIIQEEEQKVNDGIVKAKTRKLKRKKLDLELLRLNCKVIDVATNIVDDKECTKPYCKMGCVCKSLLCETHTVNHLEDKAKKNLAKVEREFTQTLIHTDNDVILVGTGGRNRTRTSKVPKKYTDYIGDIDEIFDSPKQPIQVKEKIKVEKCTVDVLKLNLDNVIPYCLFHNMYNCFCKGEIVDWPAKIKTDTADHIPKIRIVKTKEDQHKSWYNSCARIRKVFPEYKARNKDPLYNQRLRAKSFSKEIEPRLKDVKRQQVKEFAESNVVVMNADKTQLIKKPSKRKQSFNIREDVVLKNKTDIAEPSRNNTNDAEKEYALQRRKKKLKPNAQVDDGGNSLVKYCPIFDGEIRLSVQDNQDILEIVGEENASLEYLRILPWSKVIESFRSGKLKIWGKEKPSSTLMCNAAGYFPPKSFVDIRNVQQKSDIINWILTDNLPGNKCILY